VKKAESLARDEELSRFRQVVLERAARRGLSVNPDRIAYLQGYVSPYLEKHGERVLYVGVGHGHDALYALLTGLIKKAVGVDPYPGGQGNDHEDYQALKGLIESYGLEDRFEVHPCVIQEYLSADVGSFTAVMAFDVLHHIFVTTDRLSRSPLYPEVVSLCRGLAETTDDGGLFLVQEAEPRGLRQFMKNRGFLSGTVNYATKQSFSEWRKAISAAGFVFRERQVYVPWALRRWRRILNNRAGLYTVSDRSISVYQKGLVEL
jgi:hypothetical protein